MEEKDNLLDSYIQELRRGTLVLSVLSQLKEEEYGYTLSTKLKDKGLDIEQNTLYPLLRRLEGRNLLESIWKLEEAKEIMDTEVNVVIVDVRTAEEYADGHIPNAVLIPGTQIRDLGPDLLPDLDQTILVYCRSGNRSEAAAKILIDMGYSDVMDFGGILDWPYEIVK